MKNSASNDLKRHALLLIISSLPHYITSHHPHTQQYLQHFRLHLKVDEARLAFWPILNQCVSRLLCFFLFVLSLSLVVSFTLFSYSLNLVSLYYHFLCLDYPRPPYPYPQSTLPLTLSPDDCSIFVDVFPFFLV